MKLRLKIKRGRAFTGMKNPRIVVKKAERKLEVFDGEKLVKTYRVGLGFAPVGDKEKQGDGKTPEGEFYIFTKNDKANSICQSVSAILLRKMPNVVYAKI